MTTVAPNRSGFTDVLDSFLNQAGLPFADALSPDDIRQAFAHRDGLFATEAVFSTSVVLWAFLAQVLRDGKQAACNAAVEDIANYQRQAGGPVPSGDTGDYCRARAKLDWQALRDLVRCIASRLEASAPQDWLWQGRSTKLIDGFTFTMPDTPDNQEAFPQQNTQAEGVGLPIARACVVLSLATGAIYDVAYGPYAGKGTGEPALLREIQGCLVPGDVAVFDRCCASFMNLAMLQLQGVDVCTRLHQCRRSDFRKGKRLGRCDHLITWVRPPRPDWMTPEVYEQIPETMTLRELKFDVTEEGNRVDTMTIITTLTDSDEYPAQAIAALYGFRWNVELDIRHLKQPLGLEHLRCKTPEMIQRELWVILLAHNLIRQVIATAAAVHKKKPRQISFTGACQSVLSPWLLMATGACQDPRGAVRDALERIARNKVAHRPGRIEPRVLKRRRHGYPLMQKPRSQLKREAMHV